LRQEGGGVTCKSIVAFLAALLLSASALAGLGQISVRSSLGAPFRAVVALDNVANADVSQLHVGLANQATFDDLNVDYEPVLANLRFSFSSGPNGPQILIRSQTPIRSSYLRFVLELKGMGARSVREYTVLLDSPNPVIPGEGSDVEIPAEQALKAGAGVSTIKVPVGGTLASVARQIRPSLKQSGISLQQAMASLFVANKNKFIAGNPLRLQSGAVLQVPSAARMRAMTEARARALLAAPSPTKGAAHRVVAAKPLNLEPKHQIKPAKALAPPKIMASAASTVPAPQAALASAPLAKSKLAAASSPAASDVSSEKIKTLEQQVDARAKDLKSANQNINNLKSQIKALEASQAQANSAAKSGLFNPKGNLKWVAMAGGAGGLLLLGALFWWWRRRRRRGNAVGGKKPPVSRPPLTTTGVTPVDEVPGVTGDGDPLAEAEVYLAYGHEEQAENILRQGLDLDPSRQDIRMKLLEIYAARPSLSQFETLAREIHDAYDGRGALWERTRAMGLAIDPENPFYQPEAGSEPLAAAPVAEGADSSAESAQDADLDAMLNFDLTEPVVEEAVPEASSSDKDKDALLDFDFSLDSPASDPSAPQAGTEPEQIDAPPAAMSEADQALAAMGFDAEAKPEPEPNVPAASIDAEPASSSQNTAEQEPAAAIEPDSEVAVEPTASLAESIDASTAEKLKMEDPALATKLDLARVYLDMGDSQGAREVLLELQKEAQGPLKQQAETMLASLV